MKIGNYSGDIRRVLMITKRAVEICRDRYLEEGKGSKLIQVDASTVNQAFNEMYKSKTVQVLQ